jgi:hypothetical protein
VKRCVAFPLRLARTRSHLAECRAGSRGVSDVCLPFLRLQARLLQVWRKHRHRPLPSRHGPIRRRPVAQLGNVLTRRNVTGRRANRSIPLDALHPFFPLATSRFSTYISSFRIAATTDTIISSSPFLRRSRKVQGEEHAPPLLTLLLPKLSPPPFLSPSPTSPPLP